ncbi:carbohydrate ABC transporter membrane protein 1 (CUT1 family) [Lachnotalea glycerini]|uniref:Carbohydrate ABC transporter membrane protein 1 (CUT1 family) n=1 Tax=Lachnotalea glycerini TaxID=1763509 RepID=A0A255IQJ2_9FIRM|nr:ABC transporter permease subunit [Lachnotalea glycerini]PXV89448.1 carbohydrate ABC transporter membrane protein 1 (CUT1 family) [Lachnotalea glycerini]RDY32364.1 sugar ABC transporter permease [Lachnotalea glycerini]
MVKKKKSFRWKNALPVYALMLPGILYFLINNYLPMFGMIIAFKKLNFRDGILKSPWCGLDNFKFLFSQGNTALIMTRNTILYNIVFIILGIIIPITVAILLNEVQQKIASRIYQTLILLPFLMSWVVVSYLAYAFLSGETGFINATILPFFGINQSISFYQQQKYWPFILVFTNQWKSLGFGTVIYLASVIGISPEFYEAAQIDGASKWKQITNITLPCLKPTIITLTILNIGRIFYSDFGLFYQVPKNSGMLYNVTQTIDTYVYNALMNQNNISMSAAACVFQSIVGAALVVISNQIIRKLSKENALF